MYKIIIDASHGGRDFGIVGKSSNEKDLNLYEAKLLKKHLENLGTEVKLTRSDDEYVNINNREIEEADLLISFKKNGNSHKYSNGCEVVYSTERKGDLKHATALSEIISKVLGTNDLGGKIKLNSNNKDNNTIVKIALEKQVDHIFLINTGYLTNIDEELKLKDKKLVEEYTFRMAEYLFFEVLNKSQKIKIVFNNLDIDVNNIVKGDTVFVDVNELGKKTNIPIKSLKEDVLINA